MGGSRNSLPDSFVIYLEVLETIGTTNNGVKVNV